MQSDWGLGYTEDIEQEKVLLKKQAEKEFKRLQKMSAYNPETGYLRSYLDWLTDMPWSKVSPNNVSVKKAARILDEKHLGMEKAKERILEYLSVMKIKGRVNQPSFVLSALRG